MRVSFVSILLRPTPGRADVSLSLYATMQPPSPCTWLSHAQSTMRLSDSLTDFVTSLPLQLVCNYHVLWTCQGLPGSDDLLSIPCHGLKPRGNGTILARAHSTVLPSVPSHAVGLPHNPFSGLIPFTLMHYGLVPPFEWLHRLRYLHQCIVR